MTDNIETGTTIVKADDVGMNTGKITAIQVEENCPAELTDLGERIAAHLKKAKTYGEKAEQHFTSAGQLLALAHDACDEDGFDAFREKFCPNVGRSRAYELKAIATGQKSLEDTRTATRERVARHRAKPSSVTVTDSPAAPDADEGGDPSVIQRRAEHQALFGETPAAAQPAVTPLASKPNKLEPLWQLVEAIDKVYELGQQQNSTSAETLTQTAKKKIQKCLRELAGILRTLRDEIAKSANVTNDDGSKLIGRKLTCSADVDAVLKDWRRHRTQLELSNLALAIRRAAGRGLHLSEKQWRTVNEIQAAAVIAGMQTA